MSIALDTYIFLLKNKHIWMREEEKKWMKLSVVQVEGSHYCCKQLIFDNLVWVGWPHNIIVFGKVHIGLHSLPPSLISCSLIHQFQQPYSFISCLLLNSILHRNKQYWFWCCRLIKIYHDLFPIECDTHKNMEVCIWLKHKKSKLNFQENTIKL
jgi:hypothetical protein